MITASSNQQIKNIKLLIEKSRYRKETGLFAAEGVKMFSETPDEMIEKVYVSEDYLKRSNHLERIKKHPYEVVANDIFKRMSDTLTPQGILTLVKQPVYQLNSLISAGNQTFLILNGVQDPGNIGTMIRTAEGAGISAVIMDRECADIFNPKVIRATMGSIYRVPFIISEDLSKTILDMKTAGVKMLAAHLKGNKFYNEIAYEGKLAILIGNEGNGLRDEITDLCDIRVKIPMEGRLESLNAAVSAALLMYEIRNKMPH